MEQLAQTVQILVNTIQVLESVLGRFQSDGGELESNLRTVRELVDTNFDQVRTKVLTHEAKIADMDQHVQTVPVLRSSMDVHEQKINMPDQERWRQRIR